MWLTLLTKLGGHMEIVLLVVGLVVGAGGGVWITSQSTKGKVAEAQSRAAEAEAQAKQVEAAAAATKAAGDLVREATADYLARTELTAEVTSSVRAKWLCEEPFRSQDPVPCSVFLLCAQQAGGTVQATACDSLVNQWISERQILIVESGEQGSDPERRDERRRMFEKRK